MGHKMARFTMGRLSFHQQMFISIINPYPGASTPQIQTKSGSNPRIQPPCLHMLIVDFAPVPQQE